MFVEQTRIFQEGLSNRHVFFKEGLCSSIRPYYLIEQMFICSETLISSRTYTNFLRLSNKFPDFS